MSLFRLTNKFFSPLAILMVCGLLFSCSTSEIALKPPQATADLPYRIEIVYFHRTDQCECMQKIEDNIRETIDSSFRQELDSGILTYTSIASDDWANGALVAKYNTGLFGLFIVIIKDNKETIVPVDEIWTMTGDETTYKEYMKDIVTQYLAAE